VVTKPPSDPHRTDRQVSGDGRSDRQGDRATGELLDELGDDAIVAQQSQPHSPKPRAQVAMETRSVVIAPDAELGSEPQPPEVPATRQPLSTEPTLVIRDRKIVEELQSLRPPELPQRRHWSTTVIWVSAALLAFGVGGLLALLSRGRRDAAEPTAAQESFVTPAPAPRQTGGAGPGVSVAGRDPEPAPSSSEALSAAGPSAQPAPRARTVGASKQSRPKPAREAPGPLPAAQPKGEIPTGI
jgi:hypothetical protein